MSTSSMTRSQQETEAENEERRGLRRADVLHGILLNKFDVLNIAVGSVLFCLRQRGKKRQRTEKQRQRGPW